VQTRVSAKFQNLNLNQNNPRTQKHNIKIVENQEHGLSKHPVKPLTIPNRPMKIKRHGFGQIQAKPNVRYGSFEVSTTIIIAAKFENKKQFSKRS